jgi:flavodoxin
MHKYILFLCAILLVQTGGLFAQNTSKKPAILIAYFTRAQNIEQSPSSVDATSHASVNLVNGKYTGNTELLAEWIQQEVGGDLFVIKTVSPYSADFDTSVNQGQKENREKSRPPLATRVQNIEKYDIVFVGFPNWWYDMPMAVYTFLETYDLSGKTIIPFCTSGGSGFSGSIKAIRDLEPKGTVREGLTLRDFQSLEGKQAVKNWLVKLGF